MSLNFETLMQRKSFSNKPLTGQALLTKLETLEGLNKTAKAKACGYVTQLKYGKEWVRLREFINALIGAQGIQLDPQSTEKRGRALTYYVSVQKNGMIMIGSGYTQKMGLKAGDRLEIKLSRQSIKLTVLDTEKTEAEEFQDFAHDDEQFDDDEID